MNTNRSVPYGKMIDKVLVAGSDTVIAVPNHTHKSITPFWYEKAVNHKTNCFV